MSPVGLRSEKGYAGDARQNLKSTDPTSRQRENEKNWSRVPDGCLTPLTVGRNVTLTIFPFNALITRIF
jgi:hypothetical protein